MFPLTPDQHHWLDVATEDEGWCSFRSCTPSRSRARTEFTKWQHTAMWYLALGWHATDFTQTFAILQFYICFRFRSHHRSRHVILHQSSKFYPNRTGRKNDVMSIFKLADLSHLGFWKATYDFRTSTDIIAINCLVFEKNPYLHFGVKIQDCGSPLFWILGAP